MKTFVHLLTFLCLLTGPMAFGQTDSLRFSVRGTVVDATGGKPLAYVAVSLPGTNYATVTNQDGVFVIKSDRQPRFVAFSLLGYKPLTVAADNDQAMTVRMARGEYTLAPAQVSTGDPLTILREAIYKIQDNCPEQPELFDCFYRVDSSHNSEVAGNGLGLAIAKSIVEKHKGRISVDSREGTGTALYPGNRR